MRKNLIKQKLREGKPTMSVPLDDPDAIEVFGAMGCIDAIVVQMEHGPVTWRDLRHATRAADVAGLSSIVSVMHGDPWIIGRTLDQGAQGITVPHCGTAEYARDIVRSALYSPKGLRSVFGGTRQAIGVDNYLAKGNDEIFIMVSIEDTSAIDNLDQILEVEDIDCFFVAQNDLAHSMGKEYVGRPNHPEVVTIVENAIRKISKAGRSGGTMVNDRTVDKYLDLGARFFVTDPLSYVRVGLKGLVERVRGHFPT
jgi:2-keto-3-deoxy-L-rhamnonate aldolase RhmA